MGCLHLFHSPDQGGVNFATATTNFCMCSTELAALGRNSSEISEAFHTTLELDRARVAEIETQILHLEHTLAQLRLEQSQVQERFDSYKYPVLTLPNENTSGILIRFLPPHPEFPPLTGALSPSILTYISAMARHRSGHTRALECHIVAL
ncbi:hypothetical protein C8R47DRAFT_1328448 [Mycena vitilis]|nr:hypothetical protein C8R47DRAFT_1328448 [Mycena vitilis]